MGYLTLDKTVIPPQTITLDDSIATAEAFGDHTITLLGYFQLNAESILSGESFGYPQLNQNILPESILTVEAFGDLSIGDGNRTVYVFRIPSAENFGTPVLTMKINPSSVTTSESFGNPRVGPYLDEPFEKSRQVSSVWKPIKQEVGNIHSIGETVWDYTMTLWDGGSTHWDAIFDYADIMKKINPVTTPISQSNQRTTVFSKSKQSTTTFTKIKEQ